MKKDECGAIFFLALGLFYLVISLSYNVGTMGNPREGFFPIMTGGSMVLFASWALLSSLKKRSEKESVSGVWNKFDLKKILSAVMVLGCVSVYLVILDTVGFLLSSPPLLFALAWIMGGKNLVANGIMGILTSVAIYWIFWVIMRVPIPLGIIFPK
jgi:putative tricarboxylic transport membrane protein